MVPMPDVDRRALAGRDRVAGLAVDLDPPNPPSRLLRQENDFLALAGGAGHRNAGDHRAVALGGKCPFHGEAKDAVDALRPDRLEQVSERL